MWFKLATADFKDKNLGKMADIAGSWGVSYSLQGGISKNNCPAIVKMNDNKTQAAADFTATFTLADGATLTSITATLKSSGAQLAQETSSTSITIAAAKITGDIIITAIASSSSTGGGGSEEDDTYTFTINPTPISATVTLSATGYSTVSGTGSKSITVANNTAVSWRVSASGYTEQTGTWTANGSDENKNVTLVASSGSGEAYWVGEKLSGKAHGTGTASSYLGTQYYYVTDEAAISELNGRTVDKMAFNFASKSGADTPTGTITVYLVNSNNSAPSNWEAKAEITVEAYPAGSQKEFDITPFTVPTGYTIGYRASKTNILGGGYMMQDYKIGGAYYENLESTSSKDAGLGGIDIHIQGT